MAYRAVFEVMDVRAADTRGGYFDENLVGLRFGYRALGVSAQSASEG